MNNDPKKLETRVLHDRFGRFAASASSWLGSTWAFLCAGILVILWILTGPAFHFSQAWQQTMQTATALATFLMVFLLQNATNRDARAINLKLNELIRAVDKARNHMIDIERLSDLELDELQATYERVKTIWSDRRRENPGDSLASK
jgi:low affinity Fe/Cu permease